MEQTAHASNQITANAIIAPAGFPGDDHVHVLRTSYRSLAPAGDLVATLFFRRLDEIAPEIRSMLPANEAEQHSQLLSALALAIASLDRFSEINPALKFLGSRFRTLGVTEFHYGAIGEALLWTLEQSLGQRWTAETADAWTAFCTEIAEIMTASR